jgi:hypothetical protein
MSPGRPQRWIAAVVIIAVVGLSVLLLRGSFGTQEIQPAAPTPFASDVKLERLDDGTLLGDVVEMRASDGFYVSPGFMPGERIPKEFGGRIVQDHKLWSMALTIYPRGDSAESENAVRKNCIQFRQPVPRGSIRPWERPVHVGNASPYAPTGRPRGPLGQPDSPKDVPEGQIRYWTYFGLQSAQPGEYVYELRLFPTAVWSSAVRFQIGEPVVLKRGLLRVTPDAS